MNSELEVIIAYIREETGFAGPLDADADLLELRILDSFNIISLAIFAQERFGVEFEGEDMTRDNLARLSNLLALIHARQAIKH